MTEPYSQEEDEYLATIEDQLMENNVPFHQMMKMYAEFLRNGILAGQFSEVTPPAQLDLVARHLQLAISSFGVDSSDESRRSSKLELWALFARYELDNSALAALTRCAVCCFYEEAGWDPDRSESVTPIPFYLFLLRRLDPGMGLEFLRYAHRHLLAPSRG